MSLIRRGEWIEEDLHQISVGLQNVRPADGTLRGVVELLMTDLVSTARGNLAKLGGMREVTAAAPTHICEIGYAAKGLHEASPGCRALKTEEVALAMAVLQLCPPIKTPSPSGHSYHLKHTIEKIGGSYISNGAVLYAAMLLEIPVRKVRNGINGDLAVSARAANALDLVAHYIGKLYAERRTHHE